MLSQAKLYQPECSAGVAYTAKGVIVLLQVNISLA